MSSRPKCTSWILAPTFSFLHLAHAHRDCYKLPSGALSLVFTQNTTHVLTPYPPSRFGCRRLSGQPQPRRTWACFSPQSICSSFRLRRFALAYIGSWILSDFPSPACNCWAGRKNILFCNSTTATRTSFPFLVWLTVACSRNSRRLCFTSR